MTSFLKRVAEPKKNYESDGDGRTKKSAAASRFKFKTSLFSAFRGHSNYDDDDDDRGGGPYPILGAHAPMVTIGTK